MGTVREIVLSAINELNADLAISDLRDPADSTVLYGDESDLDSLSLVMLIGDIEARVNDDFDANLVIASERALSLRRSPFRTVGSLIEYIEQLLAE